MKTKKVPRQDQTIQTKQDILKQRKKILPTSWGRMGENVPVTGRERGKKILEENMRTERSKQKNRIDKQHGNSCEYSKKALT